MRALPLLAFVSVFLLACDNAELPTAEDPSLARPPFRGDVPESAVLSRTDLGTLGGAASYATDVNNGGIVVGWSLTGSGLIRAFRWTPRDGMRDLGTLPGDEWSQAVSITPLGRILGVSGKHDAFTGVPVVWDPDGSIAPLAIPTLPGASFGAPSDANDAGMVVGWDIATLQHAWVWAFGRDKVDLTTLGGSTEGIASRVNGSGTVVGVNRGADCGSAPECWHTFLWNRRAGYRDIGRPPSDPTAGVNGLALNGGREVAGWTQSPGSSLRPFAWKVGEGFTLLPAASFAYATAVNAHGTIVGAALDPADGAIQGELWPARGGAVELSPDLPYSSLAVAINDHGMVAGWSTLDPGGAAIHATVWALGSGPFPAPTPPPDTTRGPSRLPAAAGVSCLQDPAALASRTLLFDCLRRRDGE